MIYIYGYGTVGQATHALFQDDLEVTIIDPKYGKKFDGKFADYDVVFICIPEVNQTDFTQIINTVDYLSKYECLTVVRSTILPELLRAYTDIVAFPEFLQENDPFNTIPYRILGGMYSQCVKLKTILEVQGKEQNIEYEFCTFADAMNAKYAWNLHNATEVLFWNYIHDTTHNSRKLARVFKKLDTLFNPDLTKVGLDGELGVGGKCFPSNIASAQQYRPHVFTTMLQRYNDSLRSKQ